MSAGAVDALVAELNRGALDVAGIAGALGCGPGEAAQIVGEALVRGLVQPCGLYGWQLAEGVQAVPHG